LVLNHYATEFILCPALDRGTENVRIFPTDIGV
jgi:hypothetical protein